jgi:hypothetical protein
MIWEHRPKSWEIKNSCIFKGLVARPGAKRMGVSVMNHPGWRGFCQELPLVELE